MKAVFRVEEESNVKEQLEEIAEKYQTELHLDDDEVHYFILVKPKLQIRDRHFDDEHRIMVWGATEEDMEYLKSVLGEPWRTKVQKLTPLEFARELVSIPDVNNKSKGDIIATLELSEKDYRRYNSTLRLASRRSSTPDIVKKAAEIMKNK
jgi:hypothetical protein